VQRLITLIVLLFASSFSLTNAIAAKYEEGVQYERIVPAQPTSTGDKVEVLEVFWYGCPHCFHFEPYIERWLRHMPKDAEFVRLPGVFRPSWEVHARAYYTAVLLGVLDKIHTPLFNAIHLERKRLNTEAALRDFFYEKAGVDKDTFTKTFHSFAVETRIRRAKTMANRYGISGVPTVVVNGKYRVSASTAGNNAEVLKVINYLVEKESKKQ